MARNTLLALLLLTACSDPAPADPLNLETCDPADSPAELLRLEGVAGGLPIDVFDLGKAVSARYARSSESDPSKFRYPESFSLVDNCGGAPLRLPQTFGLRSGAANIGGEVVLCGSDEGLEDKGVWELLGDGTRGEDLALGDRCIGPSFASKTRDPSMGIVYDDETGVVTQHLPDGTARVVSNSGRYEFISTSDGLSVFSYGANAAIHPPDGSAPIELDLPEPVYSAYSAPHPEPGGAASSGWVLALPRAKPTGGERPENFLPVPAYAVELSTGAYFQTPEVVLELVGKSTEFSLRDGLLASDGERGIEFSRSGWERSLPLEQRATVFAVLDAERVFLVGDDEILIIKVPLLLPEEGDELEPEVTWSRPRGAAEQPAFGAGFEWNGLIFAAHGSELWAYPLDGRPAFPFVPESTHLYFGRDTVTGIGFRPDSNDRAIWLFQRTANGEFEVVADDLVSGQKEVGLVHPWTPELGRILYSVRDGDAVSIRQHILAP